MKKILKILLMILIKLKQEKIKSLFTETVIYSLLYTEINKSKKKVIINLNILPEYNNNFTKEKFKRTTLYEKKSLIPIDYYVDIFQKIKEIYENLFKNDNNNKIIAIDGTYNNTNVYNIKGFFETSLSLNMGF
jgi:thymidylate kinase